MPRYYEDRFNDHGALYPIAQQSALKVDSFRQVEQVGIFKFGSGDLLLLV